MGLKHFTFIIAMLAISLLQACASQSQKERTAFDLVAEADRAYLESRWLEAEQYYSAVIEEVPEDPYAWFRLGNTQLRQGRVDSAIHAFQEALKRDPQHAKTHYNLSTAYLLQASAALEHSGQSLRPQDPGKMAVEQRLQQLKKLINAPLDTRRSLSANTVRYGWKD